MRCEKFRFHPLDVHHARGVQGVVKRSLSHKRTLDREASCLQSRSRYLHRKYCTCIVSILIFSFENQYINRSFQPDQIPKGESVVVAKYIDKPLLVDGHKCDLRLYVCVTSFDPLLIYMYEEGLVRFATVKYDKSNKTLWNPCMHLCNYSINKYHSDYVK